MPAKGESLGVGGNLGILVEKEDIGGGISVETLYAWNNYIMNNFINHTINIPEKI